MGFKRVKLLSGMLSAAAIASMAGMPVLAGETAEEGLSLANTLENGQKEDSTAQDGVSRFLSDSPDYTDPAEQAFVSGDMADDASAQNIEIPMAAAADAETPVADLFAEAAEQYNSAVLPDLSVALDGR